MNCLPNELSANLNTPNKNYNGRNNNTRSSYNNNNDSNFLNAINDNGNESNMVISESAAPLGPNWWKLDNGTTCTVTGNKNWFTSYEKGSGSVSFADLSSVQTQSGTITLFIPSTGKLLKLSNCLYSKHIKRNLISEYDLKLMGYNYIKSSNPHIATRYRIFRY